VQSPQSAWLPIFVWNSLGSQKQSLLVLPFSTFTQCTSEMGSLPSGFWIPSQSLMNPQKNVSKAKQLLLIPTLPQQSTTPHIRKL
jgi:hypothetical protein